MHDCEYFLEVAESHWFNLEIFFFFFKKRMGYLCVGIKAGNVWERES